jgi:hypothetical protein
MALFTEGQLRAVAKSRATRAHDSVTESLHKSVSKAASLSAFNIFLSHSYLDKELVLGMTESLEKLGYTVYVDWREDTQLSRDKVTKGTAHVLRERIAQSESLFFATTTSAKDSKWMPWELGYMDGKKGKSAILPISQANSSTDTYEGQEYLGIYPYVTASNSTEGKERLWIHEDTDTYIVFDAWIIGKQPRKRSQ